MKMEKYIYYILLSISGIFCFPSCTQDEFEPDPIGERIPYEELELQAFEDVLKTSDNSLFLAAWQRSNMRDSLLQWKGELITLLIASDEAFLSAGYTLTTIESMTAAELDTLLLYNTLQGVIDTSVVKATEGNLQFKSKLNLKVNLLNGSSLYNYCQYLAIYGGKVVLNGKYSADYHILRTKEADVIYVNHLNKGPVKDMWTTLQQDGRFSIFMEVLRLNDIAYNGKRWTDAMMSNTLSINSTVRLISYQSIFAPTDEAFVKAGYITAEDLRKLNDRNISRLGTFKYYTSGAPYNYRTFLKSDSIISYHSWGKRYIPSDAPAVLPTSFLSNDLINNFLENYMLSKESPSNLLGIPQIIQPFTFTRGSDDKIRVRLKNAEDGTEAATIIEPDIMTLNGPIHVVDRLFIPKGF